MIVSPAFGEDIDLSYFIADLLTKIPKASYIDARIAMQDLYEYRTGIFNHSHSKERPLASVAMFECENYTERSSYFDALLEYAEGTYHETWGLTVAEYLNLPTYLVRMLKEVTREVLTRKSRMIEQIKSESASKSKK